ncbi:MAG: hypothetical protein R3A49_08020 [Acidimicrobiia bacterium]
MSAFERIEAILSNPEIYELGELVPAQDPSAGGRRRTYPDFMLILYEALISVYGSARQVEAELAHPKVWSFIRTHVRKMHPRRRDLHLPREPMRRHHYIYGRNRYLADPELLEQFVDAHRQAAARTAREVGLLDPNGPGSFTRPHRSRLLYGDGKVVTPLFKAKPGETRVDTETGEVIPKRHEPDAGLHFEGTGETAWGTKFVLVAARGETEHSRVILDFESVPKPGAEATTALECIRRTTPLVPGATGVVYDTAFRGTHHQTLLRELGLLPINRVTAAKADANRPRRGEGRRVEKTVRIEDKTVTLPDGSKASITLYARGGGVGIGRLDDRGNMGFVELRRIRTQRARDQSGKYRWYNHYALPAEYGDTTITVRLHGTADDDQRGLNRPENVRPIPPTDPDFTELFRRRNDAESINRALDDTLYLRRAHSIGHHRQLVNVLGYALMVNSLTLHRHRHRHRGRPPDRLATAA